MAQQGGASADFDFRWGRPVALGSAGTLAASTDRELGKWVAERPDIVEWDCQIASSIYELE